MKKIILILIAALALSVPAATAQYYQMANQLTQMLQPALSGSGAYKGFAEASYIKGIGNYQADFLEFTTTQGYTYNNWFFMGVGGGVDVMFSHCDNNWGGDWENSLDRSTATSAAMVPLFTDFRFNIGGQTGASLYVDVRLGCSFLIGNNYVRIKGGYLTNQEYFYLRPSIGLRVPVSKSHPKQAVNVGFVYQLLTSNYWYYNKSSVTLNAMGLNASFEW